MIKLNVEFLGMVLYVAANSDAEERLHVLLLAPDLGKDELPEGDDGHCSHGTCATDRHHPRLFYDAVYDGGAAAPDVDFRSISLEDKALDFSRFTGTLNTVIGAVPDISQITGSRVRADRLGDEPGDLVTARVTFAAGSGTPLKFEEPWKLHEAEDVAIAHKVRWTVEVGDDQLDGGLLRWELLGLNGRGGQPLVPLRPVDGRINLRVMNVLRDELAPTDRDAGPKPPRSFKMSHFKPFYAVLENPALAPLPEWLGTEPEEETDGDGHLGGRPIGDNYTCGTARAQG